MGRYFLSKPRDLRPRLFLLSPQPSAGVPPLQGSFSDGASMPLYGTVSNCYCGHAYLLSFDKIGIL